MRGQVKIFTHCVARPQLVRAVDKITYAGNQEVHPSTAPSSACQRSVAVPGRESVLACRAYMLEVGGCLLRLLLDPGVTTASGR